jgi:hypothetical protein
LAEFDEGPLTSGLFVLGTGSIAGLRDFTPGIVQHLRAAQPLVGCIAFSPFVEFSELA